MKKQINQIMLFIFSLTAVGLTQQNFCPDWIKYAPVCGILAQPFWIIESFRVKQWGVFWVSIAYTGIWIMGIYNNFF